MNHARDEMHDHTIPHPQAVMAVLLLGNIEFENEDTSEGQVAKVRENGDEGHALCGPAIVGPTAKLLGLPESALRSILIEKNLTAPGKNDI
jgi:hypothetical protein